MSYIADTFHREKTLEQKFDELNEKLAGDDGYFRQLVEHRGGCSCHASPPCSAWCDPLTIEEAEALGWLE